METFVKDNTLHAFGCVLGECIDPTLSLWEKESFMEIDFPSWLYLIITYIFIWYEKDIFYGEKNYSLEQPPQECGRVLTATGFQDVIGQGARQPHLGSLSHKRLDHMTFWGPLQTGLFCDSVIVVNKGMWEKHITTPVSQNLALSA